MTESCKEKRDLQIFIERVPGVVSPWIQGSPFIAVSGLERSGMSQGNRYYTSVNVQNERFGPGYIASFSYYQPRCLSLPVFTIV